MIVDGFSRREPSTQTSVGVTDQAHEHTVKKPLDMSATHNLMTGSENTNSKMHVEEQFSAGGCFLPHHNTTSPQGVPPDTPETVFLVQGFNNAHLQQSIKCEFFDLKNDKWALSSLAFNEKLHLKEQLLISRIAVDGHYRCELCERKFRKKTDLSRHLCIHLDIRPHVCPSCSRGFVQKGSLNVHVKTHMRRMQSNCS